jgi:hypothetical protein
MLDTSDWWSPIKDTLLGMAHALAYLLLTLGVPLLGLWSESRNDLT